MRVLVPIDRHRASMTCGQTSGKRITEVSSQGRARDTRSFCIFELVTRHTAQAIAEREQNLVCELQDPRILRISPEEHQRLMKLDHFLGIVKPGSRDAFE